MSSSNLVDITSRLVEAVREVTTTVRYAENDFRDIIFGLGDPATRQQFVANGGNPETWWENLNSIGAALFLLHSLEFYVAVDIGDVPEKLTSLVRLLEAYEAFRDGVSGENICDGLRLALERIDNFCSHSGVYSLRITLLTIRNLCVHLGIYSEN